MRRSKSFGLCLVTLLGFNLAACGDGEKNPTAGAGGASKGGSATGGASAQGGVTIAGAGAGGTSTVTTTSVAGTTTTGGGAGGASAAPTGGSGGGTLAGGTSSGGTTTGGTSSVSCFAVFAIPADGASLANSSDLDGNCGNGMQTNVLVVTNAAEGTSATLDLQDATGETKQIGTTTVGASLQASFGNVELPSSGQFKLVARVGGPTCSATETIKTDCTGAPSCSVSAPVLTAAHPTLNGEPTSSGGDRVSSNGSAYQAAFTVSTDAEDGQPVLLTVDSVISVQSTVASGKAQFPGVPLGADGLHTVQATCTNKKLLSASTAALSYPVDTLAPSLAVSKVTGGESPVESALASGDHFGEADDAALQAAGLQLKFCAATNSSDAIGLDVALDHQKNFCVVHGGNNPTCVPVLASGETGTACTLLDCPGNGAFSVNFTLYDAAGNPTTVTRNNLTCASTTPAVSFIDPVAGTEPDKRILAATNALATKKDKNATQSGAQYDVKICTSATSGTAVLTAGIVGNTLTQIATSTVAADTGNLCNGQYPSVITFADATLPESISASTLTRLQVKVTDQNTAQGTASADLWVDSTVPILTANTPANFCGSYISSASQQVNQSVTFGTSLVPVSILVRHADGTSSTATAATLAFYQATTLVPFKAGLNVMEAAVEEPSGNKGSILDCQVTVGTAPPPKVTWSTPVATSLLTAAGNPSATAVADASDSVSGWQGTLKACTPDLDLAANPGATIQFAANGEAIGAPVTIGSDKCAILVSATVPEGAAVRLMATTSAMAVGGVGSAAITVPVDVVVPSVPTSLTATVKNRRQTSFELKWIAAADGTTNAAGYDIRIAKEPITEANFDNAAITQVVPFTGLPAAAGAADGVLIANRYIETDYYFAVRAKDVVGNRSPILTTIEKTRAPFESTLLDAPVSALRFGAMVDGTGDFNGDGLSDVLVGHFNGRQAYLYLGARNAAPQTIPSVTIVSDNNYFGYQAINVGDINGDGIDDIAISTWAIANGAVSVFYGRSAWPTTMTESEADVSIVPDPSQLDGLSFASSYFGYGLTRLGDFNADGTDDFAVGAPAYNKGQGHVSIVLGKRGGLASAISVPQAYAAGQAIRLDGDPIVKGSFGQTLTGLGSWYAQPDSAVLIVSANGAGGNRGRLYTFAGVTGTPASISVASSISVVDGGVGSYLGGVTIRPGGDLGYAGKPAVFTTDTLTTADYAASYVDAFSGADAEGPFGRLIRYYTTEGSKTSPKLGFGRLVLGGGLPGSTQAVSFVGDSRADMVISTTIGTGPRLYFVNGSKVNSQFGTPGVVSVESVADVVYGMPNGWQDFARNCYPVKDMDGDGYGDLAIGDISYSNSSYDGRVLILR